MGRGEGWVMLGIGDRTGVGARVRQSGGRRGEQKRKKRKDKMGNSLKKL